MYGKSHAPGDGIGHIQAFQRAYLTENCKDPDNAYTAGTQQTDSGGHPRPAQAAHTAAADLHQTAEEIRHRQKAHTGQTHPDHLCLQALTIRAINGQQRLTEQIHQIAQRQANHADHHQADAHNLEDPLGLLRAQILADKGDAGLVHSVHGSVGKAFDVGSSRVAGYHNRAEGVHRGLDDDVGQGEQAALNTGGQAHLDHADQLVLINMDLLGVQVAAVLPQGQCTDDQNSRNHLGSHGGNGNTGHAHVEHNHQNQIEPHIDHA